MSRLWIQSVLILALASASLAASFSQIEVVKADKVVQLNAAYPGEVNKV